MKKTLDKLSLKNQKIIILFCFVINDIINTLNFYFKITNVNYIKTTLKHAFMLAGRQSIDLTTELMNQFLTLISNSTMIGLLIIVIFNISMYVLFIKNKPSGKFFCISVGVISTPLFILSTLNNITLSLEFFLDLWRSLSYLIATIILFNLKQIKKKEL